MKQTLFVATLVLTILFGGFGAVPTAEAATSWNGLINSNGRSSVSYTNQYQYMTYSYQDYLQQYIRQLQALLEQLQAMQREQERKQGSWYPDYTYGSSDVDVTTRSATNIEDDRATLRGEVDFNSEDEATVYFRWGTSATNLRYETTNVVMDEDDDETDFSATITDLDDDTKYYYRAIAEDESGRRDYGSILSFTTDNHNYSNDDEYPDVETDSARDIEDDRAELRGSVDMNDFRNGIVFFVYGEDEDQVDDIERDYDSYYDVDEDGDDLQKVRVDSDLDGDRTYWQTVTGLDNDTDYYFAICVGFEDEDGDDTLTCGDTEDFTTDY